MIITNVVERLENVGGTGEKRIYNLPVDMITPNPFQPRRHFDPLTLVDLAASIKQHGIMQPINVRATDEGYELVAGERRLRAAKLADMHVIPSIIVEITDTESAVLALVENLQRHNLNYIEEAEGFHHLLSEHNLTQEDLAKQIGKSQSTIANKLRLLKLPNKVKKLLIENGLSERHARALLKIQKDGQPEQAEALITQTINQIIKNGLTVQKTEELVDRLINSSAPKRVSKYPIKSYIRDVRIFTNTIKQAVGVMQDSGVSAMYDVEESNDGCIITVMVSY